MTGYTVTTYQGKRYNEVNRKARVGELVKVVEPDLSYGDYEKDDVFKIWRIEDDKGVYIDHTDDPKDEKCSWLLHHEYVVLVPTDDTAPDRLAQLESTVTALTERVAELESQSKPVGKSYTFTGPIEMTWSSSSKPSYTRSQVVEMAIKDVEGLKQQQTLVVRAYLAGFRWCDVDFVVNRKKGTVVALLRWKYNSSVQSKGIAKTAPDDCFNVHIGKAIALRRALGLEVPDYYVNAPKPTEAQVGDVFDLGDRISIVVEDTRSSRYPVGKYTSVDFANKFGGKVIDDSHDFGGEGV